jgi:hypothetical protein
MLQTLTWPSLQQRRLKTKLIMQTEHAYSSFGRTRDRYACDFIFVLEVLRFLCQIKPPDVQRKYMIGEKETTEQK